MQEPQLKKMHIEDEGRGEEEEEEEEEEKIVHSDDDIADKEEVMDALRDRLESHDTNRKTVQDEFNKRCMDLRRKIDDMEEKFNNELHNKFTAEDERLQQAISLISTAASLIEKDKAKGKNELADALRKGRAELIVKQSYTVDKGGHTETTKRMNQRYLLALANIYPERINAEGKDLKKSEETVFTDTYALNTKTTVFTEGLKSKKPSPPKVVEISSGHIKISFTGLFNEDEEKVLREHRLIDEIKYTVSLTRENGKVDEDMMRGMKYMRAQPFGIGGGNSDDDDDEDYDSDEGGSDEDGPQPVFQPGIVKHFDAMSSRKAHGEYDLERVEGEKNTFKFVPYALQAEEKYTIKVKVEFRGKTSKWSNPVVFAAPEFAKCCRWISPQPGLVDEANPMVLKGHMCGNAFGSTLLPKNKITFWTLKFLDFMDNGSSTYVGISQYNLGMPNGHDRKGWYLSCTDLQLVSANSPNGHKKYGPGKSLHTGDTIGVVADTTKGNISFVLNGVNYGVAYDEIPLDKPLVPCVILRGNATIELDTSEREENVSDFVLIPQNVIAVETSWDYISLMWEGVEGAIGYQIEINGAKVSDYNASATFTKGGLLPETEYTFRVRTISSNGASRWSDPVVKKTTSMPPFSCCAWKSCPEDASNHSKYSLDIRNPKLATNVGDGGAVLVMGSSPIPNGEVSIWSMRVYLSHVGLDEGMGGMMDNRGVLVGVTAFDTEIDSFKINRTGWLYDCMTSTLCSGPPHNYDGKEYDRENRCVESGEIVGVMMDTTKGELSFIMNNASFGVAYDGIPLDKPLVPCAVLRMQGDSVELIIF